jgi:aminoglycoside phosphotransferase family enzyme/predicted kinase
MRTNATGATQPVSSAGGASAADQRRLVAALAGVVADGRDATLIETHISYVLLTGRYAYKIKKAVALGFLDFTTLEARRRTCDDELRLNRRLAPLLYLAVVPIAGSIDAPRPGGDGPPIEYAVKMREFAQDALMSRALARGDVDAGDIDALAEVVAAFHRRVAVAPPDGEYGAPERILHYAMQNFAQLEALGIATSERRELEALDAWTRREFALRGQAFDSRRRGGFVRECHGDLHLNNIARVDGALMPFDCIEFNAELRWIDTQSEIAFVAMDLEDRGRPDLGRRFRNAYLELTADYAGLAVYRFYYVYRALVRAKVAALRERELGRGSAHDALATELSGYVDLAKRAAAARRPAVVVMHGLAGSGKSTLAHALVESTDAVRIRTDVERKRMHGLAAGARSGSAIAAGLYGDAATRGVYERVAALAREAAGAGCIAIVDGAFLARWQRERLRAVASALGVPFVILSLTAPDATLRERVARRAARGGDASEADAGVLEHQRDVIEPLDAQERRHAIDCDGGGAWDRARVDALANAIAART